MRARRSALTVPRLSGRTLAKAVALPADETVIDLEEQMVDEACRMLVPRVLAGAEAARSGQQ